MRFFEPLYSKKQSEAELQAELWCKLKEIGLDPRLECVGYLPNEFYPNGKKKCRFDVVVFWPLNHRPLCIIECKKRKNPTTNTKQYRKYCLFKLPIFYCGLNGIAKTMQAIEGLMKIQRSKAPPSFRNSIGALAQTGIWPI